MSYDLVGKQVRVHLYDRAGYLLGSIEGRVADIARDVEVAKGMRKDLAYIVDIKAGDTPYRNSAGEENEGWFAIQDLEIISHEQPHLFSN